VNFILFTLKSCASSEMSKTTDTRKRKIQFDNYTRNGFVMKTRKK